MLHGLAIVARVRCMNGVKNQRRPLKRDGRVPSIGPFLHVPRPPVSPRLHQRNLPLHRLLIRYVGETGSDAFIGERW